MNQPANELTVLKPARLPYKPQYEERFDVTGSAWKVITDSVFPKASADSIGMVMAYCKARNLDILKKPVHIVPVWDSDKGRMVDSIWPSITEIRTTAMRTGEYGGKDAVKFGPLVKKALGPNATEFEFPEWAEVTVYRIVKGQKCAFTGDKVYWIETYAYKKGQKDKSPNNMWERRPHGQLAKCAEAAALRAAFPEEIGTEYTAEEMEGQIVDVSTTTTADKDTMGRSSIDAVEAELEKSSPSKNVEKDSTPSEESPPVQPSDGGETLPHEGERETELTTAAQVAVSPEPDIQDAEYEEVPPGDDTPPEVAPASPEPSEEQQPASEEQPKEKTGSGWSEVDDWDSKTIHVSGRTITKDYNSAADAGKYILGCMQKRKRKSSRRELYLDNLSLMKALVYGQAGLHEDIKKCVEEGADEPEEASTEGGDNE